VTSNRCLQAMFICDVTQLNDIYLSRRFPDNAALFRGRYLDSVPRSHPDFTQADLPFPPAVGHAGWSVGGQFQDPAARGQSQDLRPNRTCASHLDWGIEARGRLSQVRLVLLIQSDRLELAAGCGALCHPILGYL